MNLSTTVLACTITAALYAISVLVFLGGLPWSFLGFALLNPNLFI